MDVITNHDLQHSHLLDFGKAINGWPVVLSTQFSKEPGRQLYQCCQQGWRNQLQRDAANTAKLDVKPSHTAANHAAKQPAVYFE